MSGWRALMSDVNYGISNVGTVSWSQSEADITSDSQ